MQYQKLPTIILEQLKVDEITYESVEAWQKWLEEQGYTATRHQRILTEGALMGGLLEQGITTNLDNVSDDAG